MPVFGHSHKTKRFLIFRGHLLCSHPVPLPLVPLLGHCWAPSSFHPPCRYFHTMMRSPEAFPQLNNPTSLSCSRCSRLSDTFVALHCILSSMSTSLLLWGAQSWAQHCSCGLTVLSAGEDHCPSGAGNASMLPGIPLATSATRAHCWLTFTLVFTRTPRSL